MSNKLFRFSVTAIALALESMASSQASAQTVPSGGPTTPTNAAVTPAAGATSLEAVTVTADKVAAPLQRTPASITVISPRQLEEANIRSIADLDKQVPGVTVSEGGGYPLNVTIRGVGYEGLQNNSAQPGVAFVQDGVYIASPAGLTGSFLDLDQVEVLRGPQGTVNGQNADGGAINVTTVGPQLRYFGTSGEASYGSYAYARLRAAVNVPVGDTAAFRLAVQHDGHDGWLKAPNLPDGRSGEQNSFTGRLSGLWRPTDRLAISAWGESFTNRTNNLPIRNALDPNTDPRATSNDYPTPQKTLSRIGALTVAYDLDFATAKSISSFQNVKYRTTSSGDLLSAPEAVAIYGVKDQIAINDRLSKSFTQEVNLASKPGGLVDWIVGGFFLRTRSAISVFEVQQTTPTAYSPNFFPTPAELGALYGAGLAFESLSNEVHKSVAGYGQATLHITDRMRATAGARYSYDSDEALTSTYYSTPVPLVTGFHAVTGKAALEYDLAPSNTVYASLSTGVKPGGTNLNPGATLVPSVFKHETVRALELGSKNEFLNRRMRVNLSAFYNNYRNLQTESEDPLPYLGGLTNIGKSEVFGLEAEMSYLLPQSFRIDANASAMKSRVLSDFFGIDPYTAQAINRANGIYSPADLAARAAALTNVKGRQLGRVPAFSTAIGIGKKIDLADAGSLDNFVQFTYRSPYIFRVYDNPATDHVGKQFAINFNTRYRPQAGIWYAEFQITNLTGSDDVASRYAENFGVGAAFDALTPPRQFIGRLGFNY